MRFTINFSEKKESVVKAFRTDPNINRVKSWVDPVSRRLPSATAEYLLDKLPILQWLPSYNPQWLLNDFIAGITVGVMFVPQGLAYAKIATIPLANGLYSSWLPSLLYVFLGTSKEISTGPTSVMGILTAEAVSSLSAEGYKPAQIASALAFMSGIYALAVGILKLGWLLDFVSGPVLTGWISAVALVILLGQVGSLVGLTVGSSTIEIIGGVLGNLNKIRPWTLCIGFTSIAMLWLFEVTTKNSKNKYIKFIGTSRTVFVLVIYTLTSYLVNRNRDPNNYMWDVSAVSTHGLIPPKPHDSALLSKVVASSFAPFIAMSVEHLGVGRAFGLRNNYNIDKSQELVFLGATNMVNSLFAAMPVGGAMSRTAVNSSAGCRSPLNFLFTAGFVLLVIFEISPALYWIPKACLAAIIIMAVVHLVSPPRLFYRYYRISFIDFLGSMVGFWVTLFTSTEIGLAAAVGFSLVYTAIRLAFPRWVGLSHAETEQTHWDAQLAYSKNRLQNSEIDVPPEAYLVRFTTDILFPNAERIKSWIVEDVKVRYNPPSDAVQDINSKNRNWNDSTHKKTLRIRHRKNITPISTDMTPLRYIVLDFGMVSFIDTTGVLSLVELKMELRRYLGKDLQFRFVGMVEPVRERFTRSEWEFSREGEPRTATEDVIYSSLEVALLHREGDEKIEFVEKNMDV